MPNEGLFCSEPLGDALTQAFEQYGPMMVFLRNLQDVKRVLPVLFQPRSKANQQLRRECCVLFPNKHSRLDTVVCGWKLGL